MSKFEVKVYKLTIEEHPNADNIELARVGDYLSIVKKGQFKTGDLGVYIPCGAVLSSLIIERLGLEGKLAGKQKNRVKEIRLRGVLSEGLVYPVELRENVLDKNTHTIKDIVHCITVVGGGAGHFVEEGDDVTEWLGITKYEPPIPVHMAGEVFNAFEKTLKYDIENIKKFPDVFEDGEEVYISEKIHGSWCGMGSHPEVACPIVTSKGLSEKGLALKFNKANEKNLYIGAYQSTCDSDDNNSIVERVAAALSISLDKTPLYLLGEVFGVGVQDLTYGTTKQQFRLFDVYVGYPTQGRYLDPKEMVDVAIDVGIETVPILYVGEYNKYIIDEYTNGMETVSGKETNIREGIVIRAAAERRVYDLGRVILKSVSSAYLLRKGKHGKTITEYN